EVGGEARSDHLRSETENVHIVVLDALARRIGVMAHRGADAGDLAGGDRRADARAADEDAARRAPGEDRLPELASLVGIVDADCVGVGAEVHDLITGDDERRQDRVTKMDSSVVEGDGDVHDETRSRSAAARATTLSTVKPNFWSTVVPGAEAPKCSIEIESPSSPTQR